MLNSRCVTFLNKLNTHVGEEWSGWQEVKRKGATYIGANIVREGDKEAELERCL